VVVVCNAGIEPDEIDRVISKVDMGRDDAQVEIQWEPKVSQKCCRCLVREQCWLGVGEWWWGYRECLGSGSQYWQT
jgi:hypothetical protein